MTSNLTVVTVVDSISTTSMPINEFVFYRNREGFGYREILLVCDDTIPENVSIPKSIKVYLVGTSRKKIRNVTKNILNDVESNGGKYVFHMHAQKSAISFLIATIGLGIRKKTLFTIHSTFSSRNFKYKISSCFCVLMSHFANCVSYSALNEYASWVKILKGRKLIAIPNGVDISRIRKAVKDLPDHKNIANSNILVCVGRIIPIKNQEFLIKLMPYLPDSKLILIGAEDNNYNMHELAERLNVANRIDFLGLKPRDEVFKILNTCGIYISSSTIEGLPVSVLEAMCIGLLPIVSNIEPHMEIAKKCGTIKTLPLEAHVWIDNIRLYQELSNSNLCKISDTIKESVRRNYSLESMHNEYNKIYKQLTM